MGASDWLAGRKKHRKPHRVTLGAVFNPWGIRIIAAALRFWGAEELFLR
jgi:hypothetical protein